MKVRKIKYYFEEGFSNAYGNKLMTTVATTTVTAAIIILGIFLLIAINLSHNLNYLKAKPEVTVFCKIELQENGINYIEEKLRDNPLVLEYTKVSKEEAFESLKEMLKNEKLYEGLSPEDLMVSFDVRLYDSSRSEEFALEMQDVVGVDEVSFSKEMIDAISKAITWVNAVSMGIIVVLLIVSIFIISNTIKLTVFARKKEIGIMKYVGATDNFIRIPFVFEGLIIGFLGSIIAFFITRYLYNLLEVQINREFIELGLNFFRVLKFNLVNFQVFFIYIIIGIVMGVIGSIISIRKHLNV